MEKEIMYFRTDLDILSLLSFRELHCVASVSDLEDISSANIVIKICLLP